jgi:hypothetical protein
MNKLSTATMLILLTISIFASSTKIAKSQADPVVSVEPSSITWPELVPGGEFSVNMSVSSPDIPVWSGQVGIGFNKTVLECLNVTWGPSASEMLTLNGEIQNNNGYVTYYGWSCMAGTEPGWTGEGVFLSFAFRVKAYGNSPLDLTNAATTPEKFYKTKLCRLVDGNTSVISPVILNDGAFIFPPHPIHNVAVTNVQASPKYVYAGDNVSIQASVWNMGDFPESFTITAYADQDTAVIGDEITIGVKELDLLGKSFAGVTFQWNTTGLSLGNYTVSAEASAVPDENDPNDNLYVDGIVGIFTAVPCYDIDITAPSHIEFNPAIFHFDWSVRALDLSLGNMIIKSTGYEGFLRILGSSNGSIHLRVGAPSTEFAEYVLLSGGTLQVPLWLLFDPGTYSGTFELELIVCGTHRLKITVNIVSIWVCQNGCYSVAGGTAIFNWTVTGGSLIYLEAEPDLPPGWSYTVDPPVGTFFETPHEVTVNITAAPDAQEGDVGSVTLRAYKNATGMLIWQYTFFSAVDNTPPVVETIQKPVLTLGGDLLFNTTVKDRSGIANVNLCYSVNDGPWSNLTMDWSLGDTFNSTSYTLTVPHVPDNSVVKYYVIATDWLKTQTQSQTQTVTVKYDLATTEVLTNKLIVGKGFASKVNVTIANLGTIPATSIKAFVYANSTLIRTLTVPYLADQESTTLTFTWNTENFTKGSYKISVIALPLLDESSTDNNMLAYQTLVQVRFPGDVNADTVVDSTDLGILGGAWGSFLGDLNYNVNTDIDDNGVVDSSDLGIMGACWGEIE